MNSTKPKIVITLAACAAAFAVSQTSRAEDFSSEARDMYADGFAKRLPLNIDDAAGANGQPLVGGLDRADIPFLRFDALKTRIGGHVEGSYTYNLDPLKTTTTQSGTTHFDPVNPGRIFDLRAEDKTLNQIDLFVVRPVDETWQRFDVGFKIEAMWGSDANRIHANGLFDHYQLVRAENFNQPVLAQPVRIAPFERFDQNAGPEEQFDLTQAYADIAIPIENGARVRLGKVASPWGLETIDPTTSMFLSRDFLFVFAEPRTVSGAWAAYNLDVNWWAEVGVHRGWDQSLEDNNAAHNYMLKLNWETLDKRAAAAATIDSGPPNPDTSSSWKTTLDVCGAVMISDEGALLGGEFLYGYQPGGSAKRDAQGNVTGTQLGTWLGVAGYASFPLLKYVTLNGRAEYLHDGRGALGINSDLYSTTVGFAIKPFPGDRFGKGLTFRPEGRWDISPDKVFSNGTSGFKNNQWTLGIDIVYAF